MCSLQRGEDTARKKKTPHHNSRNFPKIAEKFRSDFFVMASCVKNANCGNSPPSPCISAILAIPSLQRNTTAIFTSKGGDTTLDVRLSNDTSKGDMILAVERKEYVIANEARSIRLDGRNCTFIANPANRFLSLKIPKYFLVSDILGQNDRLHVFILTGCT